jgi:hypothetical protein
MVASVLGIAQEIVYRRMWFETLPLMTAAMGIDRSLGFKEIPPCRPNFVPGLWFLEFELAKNIRPGFVI